MPLRNENFTNSFIIGWKRLFRDQIVFIIHIGTSCVLATIITSVIPNFSLKEHTNQLLQELISVENLDVLLEYLEQGYQFLHVLILFSGIKRKQIGPSPPLSLSFYVNTYSKTIPCTNPHSNKFNILLSYEFDFFYDEK